MNKYKTDVEKFWNDYEKYVAMTKQYNHITFNRSDTRWIRHFHYILFLAKKFANNSLKK